MNISFMTVLKLFYFISSPFLIFAAADDLGFCANPSCSNPIGIGLTVHTYLADEPGKLTIPINSKVEIFVKGYGVKQDLFGVLFKGKKGYFPKSFIRETSTKVRDRDLVPAQIKFGDPIVDLNNIASQGHQSPNEDVLNQNTKTFIHAQDSIQDFQTSHHDYFNPSVNIVPSVNPDTYMSGQVQPPSSNSYFDGGYAQQQSSQHLTHPPQQSMDLSANNIQHQFDGLKTVQFPQQSLSYSSADLHVHQQHNTPEVGNIPQQHAEPPFSSQDTISNTQTHISHSVSVEQGIPLQFNSPQQQSDQLSSGNPQDQQHFDFIQSSFSSQSFGYSSEPFVPSNSFSGETNRPGVESSFTEFAQAGSALPNIASEVSQSTDTFLNMQHENLVKKPSVYSSNSYKDQNEINLYLDTFEIIKSQGYDTDEYAIDYLSGKSSDNSHSVSNSDHFHQSNADPNFQDESASTVHQVSSQSDASNSLTNIPPIHPSFQLTTTELKVDHSSANIADEKSSYSAELQKSHITEGLDEKNEEDVDDLDDEDDDENEAEVEDESEDSDTEVISHHQKHNKNVYEVENDLKLEGEANLKNLEELKHGIYRQSDNSEVPSKTQSSTSSQNANSELSLKTQSSTSSQNVHSELLPETQSSTSSQNVHSELSPETQISTSSQNVHSELSPETQISTSSQNVHSELSPETQISTSSQNVHSELSPETQISTSSQNVHSELSPKTESFISGQSVDSVLLSQGQSSNVQESSVVPVVSDVSASQNELGSLKPLPPHSKFNEKDSVEDTFVEKSKEELTTQSPAEAKIQEDLLVVVENENTVNNDLPSEVSSSSTTQVDIPLNEETNITPDITEKKYVEAEKVSLDTSKEMVDDKNVNNYENYIDKENEAVEKIIAGSGLSDAEGVNSLNNYQIRNLKEDQESKNCENVEASDEMGENVTYSEHYEYTIENSLQAIRSFIEAFLLWIPEPLYSVIMDLENKGLSPRVPVFTALSAIPCILLIIIILRIKQESNEKYLTAQLVSIENTAFNLVAERHVLEEKLENSVAEFESTKNMLDKERKIFDTKKVEVIRLQKLIEKANLELESNIEELNTVKEREKEYMELVKDHEKIHLDLMEEKSLIEKKVVEQEDDINRLSDQMEEKENEIAFLQTEIGKYKKSNGDYEEKLNQLQTNCNQLLKEAEVWNMRVNELNSKISVESSAKEELQNSLEIKDAEVKSLTNLVQTLKSFEEIDSANEDECKSSEEKLKCLMDSSSILIKLQNQEEENKLLSDKLSGEKNKILEMEVELLESKSEIDKLKVNYNQSLQDKAEAMTKLEVLTNYFKDKEILLQKQLGVQEAFREKREKDADSAERQIVLIEQENESYKYQVASMKQEMEETERNLKTQIATQEKKAHENWIAARAAERKLEDMKQEVTQLRQRLTLLEREQENWINSSREDNIIRPIPKRISGVNDDSTNGQDLNNSLDPRHIFPPPPPMMLPSDRPLPPLPPLPPFLPPMEPPPFRHHQPWHHLPPDPNSDFRMTPPEFLRGREVTTPRGRHSTITDEDMGPLQSSPLGEMRDSRNSTPPHSLPDFHDIPPPPPRPFFPPPPGHHGRFPMPPHYRREFAPGQKRTDNQSDSSSIGRGTQPIPSSQENWPHNSRV